MKFDYTSDLHIDIHINKNNKKNIKSYLNVFDNYFKNKKSDKLIIAGDLGHDIEQNLFFFKLLKKEYGYKEIFTVEGNHSGYLLKEEEKLKFKNGIEKIDFSKKLYFDNGINILDGNLYTLNENNREIVIGGADSFYDGLFLKELDGNYFNYDYVIKFWKNYMPDSNMMNLDNFLDIVNLEKEKLINLQNKCDVIVTHVKPVIQTKYFNGIYGKHPSNAFFSFDWENEIINDRKLKVWVYGHTHEIESHLINEKKLLCNPLGYKHELFNKEIKTFTI
jgi:predicted phosphodiesterase